MSQNLTRNLKSVITFSPSAVVTHPRPNCSHYFNPWRRILFWLSYLQIFKACIACTGVGGGKLMGITLANWGCPLGLLQQFPRFNLSSSMSVELHYDETYLLIQLWKYWQIGSELLPVLPSITSLAKLHTFLHYPKLKVK